MMTDQGWPDNREGVCVCVCVCVMYTGEGYKDEEKKKGNTV